MYEMLAVQVCTNVDCTQFVSVHVFEMLIDQTLTMSNVSQTKTDILPAELTLPDFIAPNVNCNESFETNMTF